MVGVAVTFDLGRYHATPWGAHVNDGLVEWPPSPWRLLRGIYAVARTNVGLHDRLSEVDRALATLAQAPPPAFRLPPIALAHTRHYMPSRLHSPTAPGKTDRVLDAFAALDRDTELEVWWQASLAETERTAFGAAVSALGYLGRSESVCSARMLEGDVADEFDAIPAEQSEDLADGQELVSLLCADGNDPLGALATSIGELRRGRTLQPPRTRFVDYAVRETGPPARPAPRVERPTLACFRVSGGSRPGLHEAVTACTVLRGAVQSKHDKDRTGKKSPVFGGHADGGPRRDQHRHAHFMALPGLDGRRIDRLVVWAPEGFGEDEVGSLAAVRKLWMRDLADPLRLALTTLGEDQCIDLPQLLGPSDRWRSLTPFALPRHTKRRSGRIVDGPEDQIRRELTFRDPHKAELLTRVVPIPSGNWVQFRRTRPRVSRLEAPRVVGAELHFAEPVRGPIALGALSHFGLGLFTPQT
jgi:CRISPR-associated protein Csb2